MNKNFIIAGAVVLVVGLAVAIGVSLVDEPLDGNLPEGETTITGQGLPEYAGDNDDNVARGLDAPIFSGPNENSEIVSLEKNGNAKVLLFLAHFSSLVWILSKRSSDCTRIYRYHWYPTRCRNYCCSNIH